MADPRATLDGIFGQDGYRITSGYRSPEHNRAVGGAPHSDHLTGEAYDIVVPGMSTAQTYAKLKQGGAGGYLLDEHDHVHWSYDRGQQGGGMQHAPDSADIFADEHPGPTAASGPAPAAPAAMGGGDSSDIFADEHTTPHESGITAQIGGLESGPGWSAPTTYHGPPTDAPSAGSEAWSGFSEPFVNLGHNAMDIYRRNTGEATAPLPSIGDAVGRFVRGGADLTRLGSDAAATTGAPLQALVRPVAGAISRALPAPKATHTEWDGIIPHQYVDGDMNPDQARAAVEGGINTALQGARAPGVNLPATRAASLAQTPVPAGNLGQQWRGVAPQMPVIAPGGKVPIPSIVSGLKAEKQALYAKVDASGFRYAPADLKTLAGDVDAQIRARGGPKAAKASPQADSLVARLRALAGEKSGATATQLDELRRDVWPMLMENGGPDAVYGGIIRKGIDQLESRVNVPVMKEARAANMRWAKADEVANRVRSAQLQAGRANSGENLGNAIRQKISPMIDPMHSGQVQNLTPAEAAAVERVVVGDKTQNTLRTWSNRLRNPMWTGAATTPAALMGFSAGGPLGGASAAGLTAAGMQAIGQGLRSAAEKRTMANVDKLIELIAGGKKAKAPAVTRRGLIGGSVLLAPTAGQSDRRR